MFDFSQMLTDHTLETTGTWVPFTDESRLLIARQGNDEYTDLLQGMVTANRALIDQNDKASRRKQQEILEEVYAKTILKSVDGIMFEGVAVTPENYTPAIGLKMFRASKDFFKKVQGYAQQADLYRRKAEDEAVGN